MTSLAQYDIVVIVIALLVGLTLSTLPLRE